jgi:regulator of protease activity HflC (stomatin/prohibitin superfamily)
MTAAQLRSGNAPAEVEFQFKSKLHRSVGFAGITPFPPTVELMPPSTLDTTLREADEKRVMLEIEHYQKQTQAKIDAAAKQIETEATAILRNIEAKAEAGVRRTIAEADVDQQRAIARVYVQKQAALSRITADEMKRRYQWLASEPLEMAETFTDAEKFKSIVKNAASINVITPMPATFGTPYMPSFMQQPLVNTNGHNSNGKEY